MATRRKRRMSGLQIAREYFPKASRREIEFILWNKTGWPCFFREGEKSFREQLAQYKRAVELNRDVCYCCGKIRFKSQMRDGMCAEGLQMLKRANVKLRAERG